jgi:hypothetical protein
VSHDFIVGVELPSSLWVQCLIHTVTVDVEFQASDLSGKWNYFRVARDTSRIDVKRGDRFLQADLNLAAGAADASRAMLRTLCLNVAHPIAVLAHAHILSTAKPTAYR